MKTITITLITLALCALVGAQEAKIMILERRDTDTLKSAYAEYKAAQKRWETAKYDVAKRYTTVDGKVQEGWEKVQFSVDFRAMVPERNSYSGLTTWTVPAYSNTLTGKTGTVASASAGTGGAACFLNGDGTAVCSHSDDLRTDITVKEPDK